MPRIKVIGYLNTDDLDDDQVDLSHATGLTEEAFMAYAVGDRALFLDGDASFVLENGDDEAVPFLALGNSEPIPEHWPEELKAIMREKRGEQ